MCAISGNDAVPFVYWGLVHYSGDNGISHSIYFELNALRKKKTEIYCIMIENTELN